MDLKVTSEQLQPYSIFCGVPMYGGACSGAFTKSTNELSSLCANHGIKLQYYYLFNESLIQRARNYVVDEFLRSKNTHLMFIDADISFNPHDVLSLLAIQITEPDKYDVIAGIYPKKTIAWEKVKEAVLQGKADNPFDLANYGADYAFNPLPGMTEFRLDEPLEVSETSTGFMLIPRAVFTRYEAAYPEYKYLPDHARTEHFDGTREIMAYFDCSIDPVTKRYLSEDYHFCQRVRKTGMKVHICPWMELVHIGSYPFRGSLAKMASLGVSPTAGAASNAKNYPKQKDQFITPPKKIKPLFHP